MTRDKRAPARLNHIEYVELVAYCALGTSVSRLGRVAYEVCESAFTHVRVSTGCILAFPRYNRNGYGPEWPTVLQGTKGKYIRAQCSANAHRAALQLLARVPEDAKSVFVSFPRRGGSPKVFDFSLAIGIEENDPNTSIREFTYLPRIIININTCVLSDKRDARAAALVDTAVTALSQVDGVVSGHCEVSDVEETFAGQAYQSESNWRPWPKHRVYNHALWNESGIDQSKYVRGVYWGNFLSPSLAARADEGGMISEQFANLSLYEGDPRPQVVKKYPNGSMFIAVSDNPLDGAKRNTSEYQPECLRRMIWLHRAFMKARLLP